MARRVRQYRTHTRLLLAAVLVVATVVAGGIACSKDEPEPNDGRTAIELVSRDGDRARLRVEIADEPEERTKGLSGRTELGADHGMLFIIERRGAGFWMKDTLIPLSVAFIAQCGEIVGIADMEPQTLQLHNATAEYRFGLEVNQGWFGQHDIAVGDTVRLPESVRLVMCPTP